MASVIGERKPLTDSANQDLTDLEAQLYQYLAQSPNRVVTFSEIWKNVWFQSGSSGNENESQVRRAIQVTISCLRKKTRPIGDEISSVRDKGYGFLPAPDKGKPSNIFARIPRYQGTNVRPNHLW